LRCAPDELLDKGRTHFADAATGSYDHFGRDGKVPAVMFQQSASLAMIGQVDLNGLINSSGASGEGGL
jgi:hypothetical protein